MVEKEDLHKQCTLYSLTIEPDSMWIDDLSGQTTLVAYRRSKFLALGALTPQPLIGHAGGVVAGSICFGDRTPYHHRGRAPSLGQDVDEELVVHEFGTEEEIMAMSEEALAVEEKDWQGIFQNFTRDGRPPDDDKLRA